MLKFSNNEKCVTFKNYFRINRSERKLAFSLHSFYERLSCADFENR